MALQKDILTILHNYLEANALDIFEAERAFLILKAIGSHADAINGASHGLFFGIVQDLLSQHFIMSAVKVLDPRPSRNYPTRTIHETLRLVEANSHQFEVGYRDRLIEAMGKSYDTFDGQPIQKVADDFIVHFATELNGTQANTTIEKLQTIRDKVYAHNEHVVRKDLPWPTYDEVNTLLKVAKRFVIAVGFAYLNEGYGFGGDWFMTTEAEMGVESLYRLLEEAGVREESLYEE